MKETPTPLPHFFSLPLGFITHTHTHCIPSLCTFHPPSSPSYLSISQQLTAFTTTLRHSHIYLLPAISISGRKTKHTHIHIAPVALPSAYEKITIESYRYSRCCCADRLAIVRPPSCCHRLTDHLSLSALSSAHWKTNTHHPVRRRPFAVVAVGFVPVSS